MYTYLLRATLETWPVLRKHANAPVGYRCCQSVSRAHSALSSMEVLDDAIKDVLVGYFWAAEHSLTHSLTLSSIVKTKSRLESVTWYSMK